jgi:hypothetical protein
VTSSLTKTPKVAEATSLREAIWPRADTPLREAMLLKVGTPRKADTPLRAVASIRVAKTRQLKAAPGSIPRCGFVVYHTFEDVDPSADLRQLMNSLLAVD